MTADLVVELVEAAWSPPYDEPLIVVPDDVTAWSTSVHDAIRSGLVERRPDGVLIPAGTVVPPSPSRQAPRRPQEPRRFPSRLGSWGWPIRRLRARRAPQTLGPGTQPTSDPGAKP